MKTFINKNFVITNSTAEKLYHSFAADHPIIDFHCHLSPQMIAEDRQFNDLGEIWLEGDHYKWRAMRINGIPEKYCTGKASNKEKFDKYAETVPSSINNPLYHWTHLELARYFNIYDLLSPNTADKIFNQASEMLRSKEFSTRNLIRMMKVETICTTDDPVDNLEFHIQLHKSFEIPVFPTFRPDNFIKIEDPVKYKAYISKLEDVTGSSAGNFSALIEAIDKRHAFFHEHGCRLSDHGLDRFPYSPFTQNGVYAVYKKLLKGEPANIDETEKFKTAVMFEICKMNHKRGWVQQFHVGAIRNNNARLFKTLGPDTGFDSIGVSQDAFRMSKFLSLLDESDQLAKSILYNLNPADNEMMLTMAGNFNDGSTPAKVQYGAGWWFLDQKTGMEKHLRDLSALGLLRRFVGMVTDSRSFLSYPRHEYFRRIACNYIGEEVEKGLIPDEDELLKPLIQGISYMNAKDYFSFSK